MTEPRECDGGMLVAFRDAELEAGARRDCERHLASCPACRAALARLEGRASSIAGALGTLDPHPGEVCDPIAARAALADRGVPSFVLVSNHPSVQGLWKRSMTMIRTSRLTARWRPAVAAGLVVVLIAALLALAPVRHAAAQFLAVFRVRQITVVPVRPTESPDLARLEAMAESGVFGEPEFLRRPTEPEVVPDLATAEARAGFPVGRIEGLAEGVTAGVIEVATGPRLRMALDRATIELAVTALGLTDVTLPDVAAFEVEVDVPTTVAQDYRIGEAAVQLIELPSPTVTFPPDVPVDKLGELYLRVVGLDAESAARMASEIDWTSTLVLPLPTDEARYEDVTVGGQPAILVTGRWSEDHPRHTALVWQKDGIVHALSGTGVTSSLLVRAAEAVRQGGGR